MKLNESFLIHQHDGETLLIPTAAASFHGIGEGNETVAVILNCLKNDTTEQEITDALCAAFEGSRAEMAEDVHSVITKLRKIGAISE